MIDIILQRTYTRVSQNKKYKLGARKVFHVQLHINYTYNEIIKPTKSCNFFRWWRHFKSIFIFFLTFAKNRQYDRLFSLFHLFFTFCKNRRMNRRKTSANFNSRKRIHKCDHCGLEFKTKYRLQQHLKTSTFCQKKSFFLWFLRLRRTKRVRIAKTSFFISSVLTFCQWK